MVISPRVIRLAGSAGSIPVTADVTFHQVQRTVAPTRIAAQENAGVSGLFGSVAHELMAEVASLLVERIPTSSSPVGTRA